MRRLTVLLAVVVALAGSAIPAGAQTLCDPGTGHCITSKEARYNWHHQATRYRYGSTAPTVTTTTEVRAGKVTTCETVGTNVYFVELWPWGWRRGWTYYGDAKWCHINGHLTGEPTFQWTVDFGNITFWERDDGQSGEVTGGSAHGKWYYDRRTQGLRECVAKIGGLCFPANPWIAMTLRGDGTHWVCGSDGECYGTPPK